jgi:hypothetical protein
MDPIRTLHVPNVKQKRKPFDFQIIFNISSTSPLYAFLKRQLVTGKYEGQSKSSLNSLTPAAWCTMSSYHSDRMLLVIATCKHCRGCAMQFGGSGATSGRDSGLCTKYIAVITRAPYSPDLAPSDFWLFPTLKNGPQGDTFLNHGRHQIECDCRTPEDSKIRLKPVLPTMPGSMEQMCVGARILLWRWLGKSYVCPTITVQYCHSGNFPSAHRAYTSIFIFSRKFSLVELQALKVYPVSRSVFAQNIGYENVYVFSQLDVAPDLT